MERTKAQRVRRAGRAAAKEISVGLVLAGDYLQQRRANQRAHERSRRREGGKRREREGKDESWTWSPTGRRFQPGGTSRNKGPWQLSTLLALESKYSVYRMCVYGLRTL